MRTPPLHFTICCLCALGSELCRFVTSAGDEFEPDDARDHPDEQ